MKNNNDYIETPKGDTVILGGWNQPIKAFPTVEIPLDEYRAFIEFKAKGPTVEVPLQQYDELKETNMRMQGKIWDLENQIRDLENELEKREQIAAVLERVGKAVTDNMHDIKWTILGKIKEAEKNVSDSVTGNKEKEEAR